MSLEQFMDMPDRITYPGILDLSGSRKSDFSGGTTPVLLPDWSVQERMDKYFEFLEAFDRREDPLLREHVQQFSHRLHWDEHPYCDVIRTVTNNRDKMWLTLLFSFTNEKWDTFMAAVEGGVDGLRAKLSDLDYRPARSDLFQIYYPKGTKVREWLVDGTWKAANDMHHLFDTNWPFSIMSLAYHMRDYFVTRQGFDNALYPCKNFARYMAMGSPHLCDPESYVHPGTGSFRGLHQIFGGKYLMSSAKYDVGGDGQMVPLNKDGEELRHQLQVLSGHPDNPVLRQNLINHEDKACFFFKHLAMHAGVQKPTKSIPYGAMFPENWSLRTGKYE